MDWREAARAEINNLKRHWVEKYGWRPEMVESEAALDLFIHLRGRRLGDREYVLRLRYLADWATVGRRETFVNPEAQEQEGLEYWPPDQAIRGVNPVHRPQPGGPIVPCICLRGVWGYHSVLHTNERPDGTTLLAFLLELQGVIDE